jgi:predicted small lipoprotein YifL
MMSQTRNQTILSLLAAVLGAALMSLGACGPKGPVPEAPAPRRPKEIPGKQDTAGIPDDCQPLDPSKQSPPVAYRERSVIEAKNLADEGFTKLQRSADAKVPQPEREQLLDQAVDQFITALLADPYNVHATYNLAAAYARIGRGQCAVNLLERLAALHRLPSLHDEVEVKLDRLLGRGRYRNDLDPDFYELRDEEKFREVIKKFQK